MRPVFPDAVGWRVKAAAQGHAHRDCFNLFHLPAGGLADLLPAGDEPPLPKNAVDIVTFCGAGDAAAGGTGAGVRLIHLCSPFCNGGNSAAPIHRPPYRNRGTRRWAGLAGHRANPEARGGGSAGAGINKFWSYFLQKYLNKYDLWCYNSTRTSTSQGVKEKITTICVLAQVQSRNLQHIAQPTQIGLTISTGNGIIFPHGELSERFKELVLKTSDGATHREFESHTLRQNPPFWVDFSFVANSL